MNIMDNMVEKIPETMENSGNYYNMHTLNKDLERLVACGAVTMEEALQSRQSRRLETAVVGNSARRLMV